MKSKRSRTYLVSGLTLALIFVAIILVFHDVLPDIVKDLSTVPFWGVLLLLALGLAYEAMESVLCLVIIHHKKPDCTFIDALRVTFLGVCAIGMGISSVPLMQNMPAVILAVVAGTALGLACHLGEWISRGGELMEKPIGKLLGKRNGDDEDGLPREEYLSLLVTAIVLFCSSGTGIYGCLDAGMTGNATVLLSKSILDFFTAMVFACNLGAVTSLVAVPQAAVFFALFFAAKAIYPLTTTPMIGDFKACGGFLLIATGCRIAKMQDFPVADMIPAMVLVMSLSALWTNYIAPLL